MKDNQRSFDGFKVPQQDSFGPVVSLCLAGVMFNCQLFCVATTGRCVSTSRGRPASRTGFPFCSAPSAGLLSMPFIPFLPSKASLLTVTTSVGNPQVQHVRLHMLMCSSSTQLQVFVGSVLYSKERRQRNGNQFRSVSRAHMVFVFDLHFADQAAEARCILWGGGRGVVVH